MRTLLLASALIALNISLAGSPQSSQPAVNSPVGIWRKVEAPGRVAPATLTITNDKFSFSDGADRLEADYGLTRDSILFGIITKISGRTFVNGPGEDDTFSFRFRADADELNVRGIKGVASDSLARIVGRYTKGTNERAETPIPRPSAKSFKK
jgi:hypothetical protein